MVKDNLKQKALSGVFWAAIQKYSSMGISLISGVVLARLLTPDDYGSIGMLAIFMSLAQVFIDAGFGSALIQKKNVSQADYSTVFYFNMVMSGIIYLFLFLSAPYIATFYRMPILSGVLRTIGLVLFLYSLNIIQLNQVRKAMQFKSLSIITVSSYSIALIITIYLAYAGWGVWALVVQQIVAAFIQCICLWIYSNWRPSFMFSWSSFRCLFGFGSYMFLTRIISTISEKISGLVIGRLYTASTMGYYSKAETTEDMASMSISSVLIQITYPLYSSLQDDKERLIYSIKLITSTLSFVMTPIMCLLILLAKPIFVILYSEKWLPGVPFFQILCVAGIAKCLQAVNYQAVAAVGKSKIMFKWEVVKRISDVILMIIGILCYGLLGLLWGKVISMWLAFLINITMVSNHVGYKNYQQLLDLAPAFLVSAMALGISYLCSLFLCLSLYWDFMIKVFIFFVIYFGWCLLFKPAPYTYALSLINLVKIKNKK